MKRLLFVDGNNLAARSNHAMQELTTATGYKTGAILGFLKGLSWVRHQTQILLRDVVVFWDGGHAEGRLKLYPEYKDGRQPKDKREEEDRLRYYFQLEVLREFCAALGVRQIHVAGCEADDLISIFCNIVPGKKIIFSADGDFHQLHSKTVSIFDPKKGLLGEADIVKKWGTEDLSQIPFLKAMIGDNSDNIKGIEQVGPKRAQMVSQYIGWNPIAMDKKRKKWIDKGVPEKESHKKYFDRVKAELTTTINRNILLMRLPESWEQSFYNEQQAESAMECWLARVPLRRTEFLRLCRQYELQSILDNFHRW